MLKELSRKQHERQYTERIGDLTKMRQLDELFEVANDDVNRSAIEEAISRKFVGQLVYIYAKVVETVSMMTSLAEDENQSYLLMTRLY